MKKSPYRMALTGVAMAIIATASIAGVSARQDDAPRERVLISEDWRFKKGDPADLAEDLRYDVLPADQESQDGEAAEAEPEAAIVVDSDDARVLKPWILPSANEFIADPADHYQRPDGNPGSSVSYVQDAFDDSGWERVNLPHDWAIEGPWLESGPYGGMGRLKTWGEVWYRKELEVPASYEGKSVFLDVDGAMSYATVWLNGNLVGGWPYGYNSWRLDLTDHIEPGGSNQLAIRLDSPRDSSRWYPGAGLYRDVWLVVTEPVHVAQWGVAVTTPEITDNSATVQVEVAIDNDTDVEARVDVRTELYELSTEGERGKRVTRTQAETISVPAGASALSTRAVSVRNPRLWGPVPTQTPNRYLAVTSVMQDGELVDRVETPFGIREIEWDSDQGLIVNGEHIQIKGVNNHHDLGALGGAFNVRAAERQLEMLQEMGSNAIRMAHNPPAPELLELTDRMGFLVVDEVFDVWERRKTPYDFHLIFPDWYEADLRSMIRRDRNHPSVVLWSVGNEVGGQYTGERGGEIARELVAIAHDEDPTRLVTMSVNWSEPGDPLPNASDVINLNYQGVGVRTLPSDFPRFREVYPGKVILSSESAAALSSRGEYQFPVQGARTGNVRPGVGGDYETAQVSAYELHAADFGSSADKSFALHDQYDYVAGEFVWTGWDYIGEPTPFYGDGQGRSSYFGIIDLAGFKKDRFYLYQSHWRPDLPMAHILPHWTWPGREGEVTPVHVFTSGDEAELFINGESQGRQAKRPYEYRIRWDFVTYEPGEVRVVAYKDGEVWAEDRVVTAGEPSALQVQADRSGITADGRDLSFVSVTVTDAEGVPAPEADIPVTFTIEGPGEIVATDNGDPTSYVPFQATTRPTFNGKVMAIVRGEPGEAGTITVRAAASGLETGTATVTTTAP